MVESICCVNQLMLQNLYDFLEDEIHVAKKQTGDGTFCDRGAIPVGSFREPMFYNVRYIGTDRLKSSVYVESNNLSV